MPDLSTITSILTSLSAAADIAKLLKDSDVSLENAETKLKLAELVSSLADAKLELAEIQELLLGKDRRIRDLEEALNTQESMVWRDPVYYQEVDSGAAGPFCPQCYDNEKKVIRLQTRGRDHLHCMTCDNDFFGPNYTHPGC